MEKDLSEVEINLLKRVEELVKATFERQKLDEKDVSSKK